MTDLIPGQLRVLRFFTRHLEKENELILVKKLGVVSIFPVLQRKIA